MTARGYLTRDREARPEWTRDRCIASLLHSAANLATCAMPGGREGQLNAAAQCRATAAILEGIDPQYVPFSIQHLMAERTAHAQNLSILADTSVSDLASRAYYAYHADGARFVANGLAVMRLVHSET